MVSGRNILPEDIDQVSSQYRDLDMPVLCLWGDHDRVIPLWVGRRLAEEIPGGELVILPRCGHVPPEEYASRAKQAAKMDEVRVVSVQEAQVTVVVERPLAKTFVHLNSLTDRINNKLFFGERFTLAVRENLSDRELRQLLEAAGVAYVADDVVLPELGADA